MAAGPSDVIELEGRGGGRGGEGRRGGKGEVRGEEGERRR